jgi:heparan-alpha-glucosaminide N-acetyltransferase
MKVIRLNSIDIFRALTMLLMIFVNDLWTLSDIPGWLEHKAAQEDGMGLADVVFPAFLFIVGLSIPWAIEARMNKGHSKIRILKHIIERTLALLVMGVFMVNLENINASQLPINKNYWQILMTLAFFMIWNNYRGKVFGKIPVNIMKIAGVGILLFLAVIYKGGSADQSYWMKTHWWGILGLIGWGYLVNALLYLGLRNRLGWMVLVTLAFYLLNVNEFITPFTFELRLVVSASNHASVMTGMLVSIVLINLRENERMNYLIPVLLGLSLLLIIFGFATRPLWGISKIQATPSWTAICAGISTACFVLLHIVADRWKMTRWADIIAPAGYATLTCYLLPYYAYAIFALVGLQLPGMMLAGLSGLIKSLVFSLLIVMITGWLGKLRISLKI